jgi:hypothetical protein
MDRRHRDAWTKINQLRETLRKKDAVLLEIGRHLKENQYRFDQHGPSCRCGFCCINKAFREHEAYEKTLRRVGEFTKINREAREANGRPQEP